jgi:hypothetical protein
MSTRIWPSNLVQRSAAGNLILGRHEKGRLCHLLCFTSRPQATYRLTTSVYTRTPQLNQTSRPEHATSVNLLSIEIKTSVSADDPVLQFAIWASAGLQAIANVFGQDLPAAETIPPAFVMSMRGAEYKIAYM